MISAQDEKDFALYLLPEKIGAQRLARLDLKKIKPPGEPFLTREDLWSYLKDTHEIKLGFRATARLKKLKVPAGGRPFVVFAGGEPVYAGAFWNGFSSLAFKGVAVDVANLTGDFAEIKLELDYPPLAPKNPAFDPRADERIFKILESGGKLYEQVWLSGTCKKIRATGKRRQSYVFTFAVTAVVKSTYELADVSFELYSDARGGDLRRALRAEAVANSYVEENWGFDAEKEFLLKFERRVRGAPHEIYLKDFEPKQ